VYETKIHDIDDLRKRLMQTWFDLDQDITNAANDQWRDHLRSCACVCVCVCVCAGGGHFEHMVIYITHRNVLWNESMYFDARNSYFVANIISWSCVDMHFQCFDFHKVV